MKGAIDDHAARFDELDPDARFGVRAVAFVHERVGVLAGDRSVAVEPGTDLRQSTGAD